MVTLGMPWRARAGKKLYAWSWRARYWWMDTDSGAHARVGGFCLSTLVVLLQLMRMSIEALRPVLAPAGVVPVQKAFIWWVVALIVALVAAVASYVLRPRFQDSAAAQQTRSGPTTEDGLCVDDHFGQVRITDEHVLAWKVVKTEKIKSKTGGKK